LSAAEKSSAKAHADASITRRLSTALSVMLGASMNEKASGEGGQGAMPCTSVAARRWRRTGAEEQPEEEWRAAIGVFRWQW
jgi:hypothetical protein